MRNRIWFIVVCAAAVELQGGPCPGSGAIPAEMKLTYSTVKLFPSMALRSELKIGVGAIGDPAAFNSVSSDINTYAVFKKDPNSGDYAVPIHVERADSRSDNDVVYLLLTTRDVSEGDQVGVCVSFVSGGTTVRYESSEPVTVKQMQNYALSFEPGYVASEQLTNGQKRSVGHVDVNFEVPYLPLSPGGAAWYVQGRSALSTDGKDKTTAVDVSTGLRRNLLRGGYLPGFIEGRGYGNQTTANASAMIQGGVQGFVPAWRSVAGWHDWLANSLVDASASPDFKFTAQQEWRIEQDPIAEKTFPGTRSFRIFSQFHWALIRLLPPQKDKASTVEPGALSLELLAKGWFLPHQQTLSGNYRRLLEGDLEVSLLIAASKFSLLHRRDSVSLNLDGTPKQRVRLKYTYGANEDNGFTHVHQLSIGIESAK